MPRNETGSAPPEHPSGPYPTIDSGKKKHSKASIRDNSLEHEGSKVVESRLSFGEKPSGDNFLSSVGNSQLVTGTVKRKVQLSKLPDLSKKHIAQL